MTQPPETPWSVEQYGAAILKEAELTPDELLAIPMREKHSFATDAGEVVWEVGKTAPGRADWLILAMFDGDQADETSSHVPGDLRVYVAPMTPQDPKKREWRRYTLSRVSPQLDVDAMTRDRFVECISDEWRAMAFQIGVLVEDEEDPEPEPEQS